MKLVLPMHNAHPYFSLKNLGKKKFALYMAKYGMFLKYDLTVFNFLLLPIIFLKLCFIVYKFEIVNRFC